MTVRERPPKLTNTERKILNVLYEGNQMSTDLARLCNIEADSIGGRMAGLRRKGLVEEARRNDHNHVTWRAV